MYLIFTETSVFLISLSNITFEKKYGSKAYEELFGYYMDSGEMPYGTMKARDGDPDQWIADRDARSSCHGPA